VAHPERSTVAALVWKARRVAGGMVEVQCQRQRLGRLVLDQAKELVPPPYVVREILATNLAHGYLSRLQLLGLLVVVRQVWFWERLRVIVGGMPVR